MRKLVIVLLLFSVLPVMAAGQTVIYTCPMHPQIHSPKPGDCPICGMRLVLEKSKPVKKPAVKKPVAKKPAVTKPPVTNNQPEPPVNNVPEPVKDSIPKKTVTDTAIVYTCPMHPEIRSNTPGKCPKCGMNLVPAGGHEQHAPDSDVNKNLYNAKSRLGPIRYLQASQAPRTVVYHLTISDTQVNFSGKQKRAIAVNGQIPMPTLTFTEGDTAEIHVYNNLDEETSLHWHGLFLPNRMDGVPFLTQMPIKPHGTYLYKFPIVQHGTHWYHSHSKLQEQIGMYGAFIMNKRSEWDIPTIPLVISEWTDMKPEEVHRSLRSGTDWFAIRKGSTQSYSEAIRQRHFKTKLTNEWKRMNAMDVSDVYYDKFLVNGKNQIEYNQFKGGDKIRLRIANAGASDYFWLSYAGGKITVVASDGNDVEPVEVDRLIIAVSETYDVVVTIPADGFAYEFQITPEDRTKSASVWLGNGKRQMETPLPRLEYFAGMKMMNDMMDMKGNIVEMEGMRMQNQVMDMNTVMYPEVSTQNITTLNYEMLKATTKTSLPPGTLRELHFNLTGNMNRYVWSLDNKVVSETDKILVRKGENLRIILFNNSMMRHPMHLHGHDFRVLNGQGDYAPLKNIIDIMPMERDTIEFAATEPGGDWFFHCHILYHMMSGMGRVFSYENSPANPDITDTRVAKKGFNSDDRRFHPMGRLGIESNGSDGEFMLSQTRWRFSTLWHLGLHSRHGYESETMIGRYLGRNQWWFPYFGFDYHYKEDGGPKNLFGGEEKNMLGQSSNKNDRKTIVMGISYTLPLLVNADARVDGHGKFRFQLSREDVPLTPRLRFNWMLNTDKEYMAGFRYILTKYFSLSTHYDSDMGLGAGFTITY